MECATRLPSPIMRGDSPVPTPASSLGPTPISSQPRERGDTASTDEDSPNDPSVLGNLLAALAQSQQLPTEVATESCDLPTTQVELSSPSSESSSSLRAEAIETPAGSQPRTASDIESEPSLAKPESVVSGRRMSPAEAAILRAQQVMSAGRGVAGLPKSPMPTAPKPIVADVLKPAIASLDRSGGSDVVKKKMEPVEASPKLPVAPPSEAPTTSEKLEEQKEAQERVAKDDKIAQKIITAHEKKAESSTSKQAGIEKVLATTQLTLAEAVISRAREALRKVKGNDEPEPSGACHQVPQQQTMMGEPDEEAPVQPGVPATMQHVERLEREVKELQKDVRRIDDTVTRINPEPEEEQDIGAPASIGSVPQSECPSAMTSPRGGGEDRQSSVPPICTSHSMPAMSTPQERDPAGEAEKESKKAAPPPPPTKGKGKGAKAPAPPPMPKGARPPPAPKAGFLPGKARAKESAANNAAFGRKLYWKTIDIEEDGGTIFDAMRRENSGRQSFNASALQKMFSGESDRIRERARRSTMVLSRQQKKAQGLQLLGDNRARNVAIVLKRLPISTAELSSILLQLRWEAMRISADDLEQIVEVIPTQEEAEALRKYKEPQSRTVLRDIERMVVPLALIKRGSPRVRLLIMARNAKAQFNSSSRCLAQIRAACDCIQRSMMLREVMALALDLGNYINHGDSSRGARAISISSLVTLKDFKAGKISSLHFLCASLHWASPDRDAAEVLTRELKAAIAASDLQVSSILTGVRSLARDCEIAATECNNFLHEYAQEVDPHDPDVADVSLEESALLDDPDDEATAASLGIAVAGQAWTGAEDQYGEDEATRYVEDPMKIRGSPGRRLGCLRRVMVKLSTNLKADMERTAKEAQATLKFCGMPAAPSQELPVDVESLLQHLNDFLKVFSHHWKEVRSDLPRYQSVFHGGTAA